MASSSVFVSCGEASGDLYAGELVKELTRRRPELEFFGLGGERASAAGVDRVATLEDVSVIGLVEVVGKIPALSKAMSALVSACEVRKPTVAVLIDFSGFHLRLARKLKALGIPIVYYISPQIWAWRKRRIHAIKALVDEVLVILPFEAAIYEDAGVPVRFVGHPLVDLAKEASSRESFCERHGLDAERPYLMMLPGSRRKEIELHMPILVEAAGELQSEHPDLQLVMSRAQTVPEDVLLEALDAAAAQMSIIDESPYDGLAHAAAAIVASGTATVEAALLETPMVVVYRVGQMSYALGKRFVDVPYFSMVNLIAERALVPELIQDEMTAANITSHVSRLMEPNEAAVQRQGFREVRKALGDGGASGRAAEAVLEHFEIS